jgi:hypothetical protein
VTGKGELALQQRYTAITPGRLSAEKKFAKSKKSFFFLSNLLPRYASKQNEKWHASSLQVHKIADKLKFR